tara:strand:+ start:186 stop:1301 length:1116 start_codon:yes stop_codon:yes gene_type:complete
LNIPVYRLPYNEEDIKFVQTHIENILKTGYLTDGGEYVKRFEDAWKDIVKAKNSIAVSNCTTALELILRCIGVKNSSVIVPTYTFYATPLSVHNSGGRVLYADISKETLSLSLESIKKSIKWDTKAVIIVHVGGVISDEIEAIREYCDGRNIYLIEDAACAHGASFNGKPVGSFGHATAYSFHHSKVLTSGEGGIVTTENDEWANKIRRMRAIGLDRTINNWEVFEIGNNYKIPETTAVMGLLHCNKAQDIFNERRKIAKFYDENLNFSGKIKKYNIPDNVVSGYYKYVVLTKHKQEIKDSLKERFNINLPPNIYDYLCHEQNINKEIRHLADSDFENARYMMEHNLCLPMYIGLTDKELQHIVDSINEVV